MTDRLIPESESRRILVLFTERMRELMDEHAVAQEMGTAESEEDIRERIDRLFHDHINTLIVLATEHWPDKSTEDLERHILDALAEVLGRDGRRR
jgi:hypothetical protein